MIGDEKEIVCKKNLADAMGKMQRNIAGVGSLEMLKEKYPDGYKKLRGKIRELTGQYVEAALTGVRYSSEIPAGEIAKKWANTKTLINEAIRQNNADEVQQRCSDFIFDLFDSYAKGGKVEIGYSFPEEETA